MYKFVREDDGLVVEVGFEEMMQQDSAGFITLEDGAKARRVNEPLEKQKTTEPDAQGFTQPPSDSLGFTVRQLAMFEEDRRKNGFTGVEFTQDPMCPFFYQVKFSGPKERDRYIRHRNMVDKNRTKGSQLTERFLDQAKEEAKARFF